MKSNENQVKSSKRAKTILIALLLGLLAGFAFYVLSQQAIVRCYLVELSDLEEIGPGLYVDPKMPESRRRNLLASYQEARDRVGTLYGEYTADPVIIAGHTMDVMNEYGGNSYNRVGRTFITLAAAFVVLGPDGQNVDVIAHELSHTELAARVGWWNRAEIPSWFDEGLAVQLDDRYPEIEMPNQSESSGDLRELEQLGVIEHNDYLAYAKSKQEVRRWLDQAGQEGLRLLLTEMRDGDDFDESYSSIELPI